MDKYLMLKELSDQLLTTPTKRGAECPSEATYWSYWDNDDDNAQFEKHLKVCNFCNAEVIRIGMAMIQTPDATTNLADTLIEKLQKPLDHAKVVLQSIGGSISEVFNSLEVVPVYRSQGPKALVLAAGGKLADAEIEIIADINDQYSLFVSIKKCRPRDGVVVQLEKDGDLLRSVALRVGERSPLGSWSKGIYSFAISASGHQVYRIEMELR
ncbi:MAG: hypothetical protein FJ146_17090 [Deltaproteobacteria bacterium]|nr:hypothetical protein [Deltaproteobacteria bacterium]